MGKPIAGRNKSPFGVDGINVDAAVLSDGTQLTNVRISKQRSIHVFDLISADGTTLYPFVKITGVDANGANLSVSDSASTLAGKLANGTFCISVVDTEGDVVGFAVRLLLNKVVLQDGSVQYLSDYTGQGDLTVYVTGVSLTPATATLSLAGTTTQQLTAAVAPVNATNSAVTYVSSAPSIATVSSTGLVTAVAVGSATITVTTVDGSFTDTTVITVTA
ncbi:major tail protein [Xanthomonas phage XbC2]|nr:major tail protein [Xanthomonas phage XbC2]